MVNPFWILRPVIIGVIVALFPLLSVAVTAAESLPGTGPDIGKTVVYRDTWGIPHIYAPTAEAGLFAMGWTQAEDRPEELLKNMARALGESAVFDGPGAIKSDMVAHMWDHYGISQRKLNTLRPELRSHLQAFSDGINAFYAAHPEDVPAWWGTRQVDVPMIIAFGRLFLYSWSVDDGFGDLKRAGIQPGIKRTRRGSNQFAIAPERTASGDAILYIDPHLAWFGPSRFWEVRIHAGDLVGSGFNLAGTPYIGLGHNAKVAWSMTTGAPDTADIYELTLNPENPLQYKYDDSWRTITTRDIRIAVKNADPVSMTLYDCHYGPVVAMADGKAYALKTSYADVVNGNEAWYKLNLAKDYTGAVDAMKTLTMFPQNVMVADTTGNIYYQRSGRVPRRPEGYDWDRPVDGSTSATEWLGIHDSADHVQILNPTQGYMQCCNIPPDAMMVNSPLTPDKYPAYIYGDLGYGKRGGWSNLRGARAVELLSNDDSVTIKEALAFAVDVHPYGVEHWVDILRDAHGNLGDIFSDDPDYVAGMKDILAWNLEERRDSTAALKYNYWRKQLVADLGADTMNQVRKTVDQYYKSATGEAYEKWLLDEGEETTALESFVNAMETLRSDFDSIDVTWGERFRVGRGDTSWPVGGGGDNDLGTTTLRNVKHHGPKADHTRWGRAGQTSTQIIQLSTPIRSWTAPPIGQSDRPDSPHYDDQAEKLFSKRTMKPTWWLPEDLVGHIKSRTVLEN
ncbi:MAG: penicillin acylase family protein [Candidatus Hydrogenedentes bacterium]|nr:penicillin acylase family protein [Candidatus Hydrogenedentota bacterium]